MRTSTPTLHQPSPAAVASRPVVTGRRSIRRVAWWAACLFCGGLVGLLFAVVGTFRGGRPSRRRVLLVLTGTAVQMVCASYFATVTVATDLAACPATAQLDKSAARAFRVKDGAPWRTTRTIVNPPVSGAALLYAAAKGGHPYRCAANGMTVVMMQDGFARRGTMYGTVFLTNLQTATTSARILRVWEHEARHSNQWAVSTLLAGPVAFPALYAADESLFSGAHNHFERQAGLTDGGYHTPHHSPPAASRLAFLLVGLIAGYRAASRRRLRLSGAAAAPDAPSDAPVPRPLPHWPGWYQPLTVRTGGYGQDSWSPA
jgi:hypothetical protein